MPKLEESTFHRADYPAPRLRGLQRPVFPLGVSFRQRQNAIYLRQFVQGFRSSLDIDSSLFALPDATLSVLSGLQDRADG